MAWLMTIDVQDIWQDHDLTFEDMRDQIVRRLRNRHWIDDPDVAEVVDNLSEARNTSEFDAWWNVLYDYADRDADRDRVWIATNF